jgi:hypothetical protein
MPYIASQYNYATPLSSAAGFINPDSAVTDTKYFTLFDNVLDGTCHPIEGDAGIWGTSISDEAGVLPEPFVITITEQWTFNAFRLVGSTLCYPVAFTVSMYSASGAVLYTIQETANDCWYYVHHLPSTIECEKLVITVTQISASNSVAMLHNVHNPPYVLRKDTLNVASTESSTWSVVTFLQRKDSLLVKPVVRESHVLNTIALTRDKLLFDALSIGNPINIHTVMKNTSRQVFGKLYITYTDPMLESATRVDTNMEAYNSNKDQVIDGVDASDGKYFTLYDNDLSGNFTVMAEESQVGWVSDVVSDANGYFNVAPYITVHFSARPVLPLTIHFDESHGCYAEDFTAEFLYEDGKVESFTFTGNDKAAVQVNDIALSPIVAVTVRVSKVSKPGFPVALLEIPVVSTILYEGMQEHSDIMSMDILEELTYEDDVEALGGVSANEVTAVIDNSDKAFYFNNTSSVAARQLRRNRKIEPWLGAEIAPGIIEWYKQGVYWSYSWTVPVNSLTATVVGFDTIGLLDTTSFTNHHVLVDKSLGELIEYVLTDAKTSLSFLSWKIDASLYDVVIPYAWFDQASHTAALRKISQAYPMHIYCDKDGNICAAPQRLHLDYHYDAWADNNTVISKEYSSLYTTLPNIVNVTVNIPQLVDNESLVQDNLVFDVTAAPTRTLAFSKPYVSGLQITIDKDASVSYAYAVYSWGIAFTFSGSGQVRSITCTGTAVDISNTSVLTRKDENSIYHNGAVTRDVSSDFIQTSALATLIINRIFDLSEQDKYDASVVYRGDISLTINDPIILVDGIAPDNRYNIRRHELSWNGALSGAADINT